MLSKNTNGIFNIPQIVKNANVVMLCLFHTEYQILAVSYFKSVLQNHLKFKFFGLEYIGIWVLSILEFKHFIAFLHDFMKNYSSQINILGTLFFFPLNKSS